MGAERCATHARRPALTRCVTCDRPACRDCLEQTRVGLKCRACLRGMRGGKASAAPALAGRLGVSPAPRTSRFRRAGPIVGVGAAAAALIGVVALLLLRPTRPEFLAAPERSREVRTIEGVEFTGWNGMTLAGSIDVPVARGRAPLPGVVVVPGFGPTTREGIGDGDPLYADLGRVLARHRLAVLRYDKRGTGASVPLPRRPALSFEHHVEDAVAALGHLRGRPEVDPARVAIVGHDEGALVALRAAAENPFVRAVVLISAPGRPLAQVVAQELRTNPEVDPDRARRERLAREFEEAVATILRTGQVPRTSDALAAVLPGNRAAYLRSVYALDPAALASRVRAPVLLVHGELDPGIRSEDVAALQRALVASSHVEVMRAPRAGHTLALEPLPSGGGHDMGGSGAGPMTRHRRDTAALEDIARWLQERVTGVR